MKNKIIKPKGLNGQSRPPGSQQPSPPPCNCTTLLTASQQRDEARAALNMNQRQIANEELFDVFMENSLVLPLHEAFEPQIRLMFHSEKCVLWIDQPDQQVLVSPTFSLTAGYTTSIPGFICKSKNVIQVRDPSQAPGGFTSDPRIASANSPQLFFPISTLGTVRGVVQIVKRQGAGGFSEADMQTASLIMRKFSIYGDSLFTSKSLSKIALSLYSGNNEKTNPLELLQKHFHCQKAELWHFDTVRMSGQAYDPKLHEMMAVTTNDFGVVGFAVSAQSILNCNDVKNDSHFSKEIDGFVEGPALFVSMGMGRRDAWAVALRGRTKQFSTADESQLSALLPFVVRSVAGFSNSEEQSIFNAQLSELLDVAAMLTSSLNPTELVKIIQEQTKSLLQCEKCILFIVDQRKKELVSHFNNNNKSHRRFPFSKGIAGQVASTMTSINLADPLADSRFLPEVDSENGYLPRSILGAPIFDSSDEVIAVVLLLTRIDNTSFDDNDIKIVTALNVFAGIALENGKLYQTSVKLSQKLRKFVEMTLHTNQESNLKPLLEHILDNAKSVMQSSRVTFFVVDNDKKDLMQFLNVGKPNKYGTIFSLESFHKREMMMFDRKMILEKTAFLDDNDENGMKLESLSNDFRFSRISGIFTSEQLNSAGPSSLKREKICCIPLFNSESAVLGVLENQFYGEMNSDDLHLLDSFAAISSLSLERIHLKQLAVLGYGELELRDWIGDDERGTFQIPKKLAIVDDEDLETVFTPNFDAPKWDGIGLFQIIFKIFNNFELMETYSITNEMLFKFLTEIRSTYNKVPYHNWRHAVDVTQFVSFELMRSNLNKILHKNDILALLVAAICHDANHDGFSNAYNLKAETPLGILYQNQSVMETHHCSVAISILTKDEFNLFHTFDAEKQRLMWDTVIQLILATDMAKHFEHLNQMNELVSKGEFDIEEKRDHKILLLQNLLKCADISNVARPFELADRWCEVLCEEFFRQGDLEKANGMEYSSPLNDREHLDKPKSQIGFYNFVCLPLFEAMAKAAPKLIVNVDQVKSNMNVWKKQTEETPRKETDVDNTKHIKNPKLI